MEPLLTTEEVAEWLRVDVVTVRRLVSRGDLAAYRIGNEYRFTMSDLEAYLQRQRVSREDDITLQQRDADADWLATDQVDTFTVQARSALTLAQEEATRFRHPYIGPEHILLGLVREGEGVAAKVLRTLGAEPNRVRDALEGILGHRAGLQIAESDRQSEDELDMVRAKKDLGLARDEARLLGHNSVGTAHLLLGLLREGEGIAYAVLESLGVRLEQARMQTTQMLVHESESS